MSRPWSSPEFEFELSDGTPIKVGFETLSSGSYDEPMLEVDGDVMIQTLQSDDWTPVDDLILTPEDRARIDSRVEATLDQLTNDYACDIGQSIAESAADALYDRMRDGD
jgi:hypothetical protein